MFNSTPLFTTSLEKMVFDKTKYVITIEKNKKQDRYA